MLLINLMPILKVISSYGLKQKGLQLQLGLDVQYQV